MTTATSKKALDLEPGFMVYVELMNGKRISELAETAGVAASTVRYYERVGLIDEPQRTEAGYRVYDAHADSRLQFIIRGKRLGLSLDEIAELLAVWDGSNCAATQDRLRCLLVDKQAEIATYIKELQQFAVQLEGVHARLLTTPTPERCSAELERCAPAVQDATVPALLANGVRVSARRQGSRR